MVVSATRVTTLLLRSQTQAVKVRKRSRSTEFVICVCLFLAYFLLKKRKKEEASTSGGSELCVCVYCHIFASHCCLLRLLLFTQQGATSFIHSSADVKLRIISEASPLAGEKNQINK